MIVSGGLTREQARRQRKQLLHEIAEEQKRKDRARLAELRVAIRNAIAARKEAMRGVVHRCGQRRRTLKERAKELRKEALAAVRAEIAREKAAAREACTIEKTEVRASGLSAAEKASHELRAERRLQRELADAEKRLRKTKLRSTAKERRQESDDEVRANLPADLLAYFERIKRSIKASPYQSRTEAVLKMAEENSADVLRAQEDESEREIARLIREHNALERAMRSRARYRPSSAELRAVPF